MDNEKTSSKRIVIFIVIMLVLILGVGAFFEFIRNTSRNRMVDFSEGWTVTYGGREYVNTDLDEFRFSEGVKRGDLISLKSHLPSDLRDGYAIVFPLQLSTISVVVNGKIVYGYGSGEYAENKMVGSALHLIRIPDMSQGAPVSIVIRVGEDNAFSYLSKIMLDETSWGFEDYLNSNIYPVVLSVSLVTAGIIIVLISLMLALRGLDWSRINQTGMLFFTIGCWNVFEIHAIQIFSVDYDWNTFARYFFGMLSVLPVLRIIGCAHKNKRLKAVLIQKTVCYLNQVLIAVITVLSIFNFIHICNVRYFFQLEAVISIAVVAIAEWKDCDRKSGPEASRFRELLACIIFIGIEAVRFLANQIFNIGISVLQHSFLLYGAVILVLMMLGSYIYELYEAYLRKAEENSLKQIAFTDGLTGLFNRSYCKEMMEELDRKHKDYYMISFDVDGLKHINDSYGHQAGDKLLIAFADILLQCFSDIGKVIRPGGDEFLVISDDAGKQELLSRIKWIEPLEKNAERALGFPVTAAYGMAGRNEALGHSTEEVYLLADQRMYEMKGARSIDSYKRKKREKAGN